MFLVKNKDMAFDKIFKLSPLTPVTYAFFFVILYDFLER